jgi:hypothetical protein
LKKIIPILTGGIGNQLFIYAAARHLSILNDAKLVLDNVTGFKKDFLYSRKFQLHHFNINGRLAKPTERLGTLKKYIITFLNRFGFNFNISIILDTQMDFNPSFLKRNTRKINYLIGYWQSEKYFIDIEDIIRTDLEIKPPNDFKNLELSKKILFNVSSVAVHFRFFEKNKNNNLNISVEYYKKSFEYIFKKLPSSHFFVFSDNPNAVSEVLQSWNYDYTLVTINNSDENAYADLWLMSLCRNFIIANSTFSWWGAWLSKNKSKIVISPKFFKNHGVSFWGFDGLIPEGWIEI